jgi:outer membrane biosynthesis protein TonB
MAGAADTATIIPDHVHEVLAAREIPDLRFRSAIITSAALHTGVILVLLLAPLLIPDEILMPDFIPVQLVSMSAATAAEPEAEPEPEVPEPEPEPPAVVVTEPEPVPDTLEALRREREAEEEAERVREEEEAEARRRAAAERRRREEEERLRAEEEARRQPQAARRSSQSQPSAVQAQTAQRDGSIGLMGAEQTAGVTVEDFQFNYYLQILLDRIATHWEPPARGPYAQPITAVVYFRIDRSGRLVVGPDIRTGSGNSLFDQASTRAIASSGPLPPLPQAYEGRSLGVSLAFKQE